MIKDMKLNVILIAAALLFAFSGCKNAEQKKAADNQQDKGMQVVIDGFTDTVELELVPMDEPDPEPVKPAESYFDRKAKSSTAAKPAATTTTKSQKNAQAETIYVETDGAQGRVWGHVTMKGDRGTGTIHDWDENTLTVSVTRHGDELFAVDQNSRQYVFKLKHNKTQE